jgi:hypothetical protein
MRTYKTLGSTKAFVAEGVEEKGRERMISTIRGVLLEYKNNDN